MKKTLLLLLTISVLLGVFSDALAVKKKLPTIQSLLQRDPPCERDLDLTLDDAILLAVRQSPNVETSRLSYVMQKFNLWVENWKFYPQFSFQASLTAGRTVASGLLTTQKGFNATPAVSYLSPYGTSVTLKSNNPIGDHYNPGLALQVTQPLIRGFGRAIVENALNNARDSEVIQRLNIENTLRSTVTDVVNAYLDIVNGEKTLAIDEAAVKRAEDSVDQTRLFIKAGHKAGNELITVQANVATAKTRLESDRNNLAQARYALLTAIGLDPNTNVRFSTLNLDHLTGKYQKPTLEDTKSLVLENDIQYRIDQITYHGTTTRALMIAKDNARWRLDLNVDAATGKGSGGGWNSGINSLINGVNHSTGVGLNLTIPIYDQLAKQSVLSAEIALKQARIALKKEKWAKETSAINGWNNVESAARGLRFAEDAERLQKKTYTISYQKYLHGLIDSLELQSAQVQLIQAEQTLLNARISYLKSLVSLDLLIGNTLRTWNIKVRC